MASTEVREKKSLMSTAEEPSLDVKSSGDEVSVKCERQEETEIPVKCEEAQQMEATVEVLSHGEIMHVVKDTLAGLISVSWGFVLLSGCCLDLF